jgi:hypothetical protein
MRRLFGTALLCLTLAACETETPAAPPPPLPLTKSSAPYREAARRLTQRYINSPMASWDMRASAAGAGCNVLLIETGMVMETSLVDAIHYGVAAYSFLPGGVKQFGRTNSFRAVAYKDASHYVWKYGDITDAEAQALTPCR